MSGVRDEQLERATNAVLERIENMQLSKAELGRAAKMSFKTVDRLVEDHVLPTRVDKRRDLSVGLGWPADAIDQLLAGIDPADLDEPSPGPAEEDLKATVDRLTEIVERLDQTIREHWPPRAP